MKKIIAVLLLSVLSFGLFGCVSEETLDDNTTVADLNSVFETTVSHTENIMATDVIYKYEPIVILNGKELDTYTLSYRVAQDHAVIPATAFLKALGGEYADSPLNKYGRQCYTFMGKRYLEIPDMHLFILEEDYEDLRKELEEEGVPFSRDGVADRGLLPRNENKAVLNMDETVIEWGEIFVDHFSLMKALNESGIEITIEHDYENNTIIVTFPEHINE